MTFRQPSLIGPILHLDQIEAAHVQLSALFIAPSGETPPPVETEQGAHPAGILARYDRAVIWRSRFHLPVDRPGAYRWNGQTFEIASDFSSDLRIAYVSCNGEEHGDLDRDGQERNAMWRRLCDQHRASPFSLLLHGGDQVYADEVTRDHELTQHWPRRIPPDPSPRELEGLRHHLRERFAERYGALYRNEELAWISARVPSLMQWDDHDICDGWGSLKPPAPDTAIGRLLFSVARESCLVFQHGCADGDLPKRFADPAGKQLGWTVEAPGLRILAPDLRSERSRHAVMGPGGWAMMEAEVGREHHGHSLILSSVPLLGPRLSLLEFVMMAIPRMQKYEDDLRDQWQSRAHREEWKRMLRLVRDMARREGHDVVALSGEIHLATRAVMELGQGLQFHQLVASGIAHRAPPVAWARFLGALASLGEAPLPEHPIRVDPLPGQATRYVADRNYLLLERSGGTWSARWDLERTGLTGPLAI